MAAKPIDHDNDTMIALANHAHGLISEFAALPEYERNRAAELLLQLQAVIAEFRRRRPAPTFRLITRRPRLDGNSSNGLEDEAEVIEFVEMPARKFKGHLFEQIENRGMFRCERCAMVASLDRQIEPQTWRFSGDSFYVVVAAGDILQDSPAIPACRSKSE